MRDDDPSGREARGVYQRRDGTLATWAGFYDECGVLVVTDDRRGEPLYGWDEDDDE